MPKRSPCDFHRHKQQHNTQGEAFAHAISLRKTYGHALFVYQCWKCKKWFCAGYRGSKADRLIKLIERANGGDLK